MTVRVSIVVVVLLIVSTYAIVDGDWDHVITVDGVNGTHNDTMCINGDLSCATLNMALKGIKDNSWYKVCIEIRPGNYTLEYGEENELVQVDELNYGIIAIIGSGMNETIINCESSAGLFIIFDQISIDSISFHNCEYTCCQYGVTAAIIVSGLPVINDFIVNNVAIYDWNGSGLYIFPTYNVTIVNSLITGGMTSGINSQIGGGIVLVGRPVYVLITHSNITNNDYSINDIGAAVIMQMSVDFSYLYIDTNITIDSCNIMDNDRGFYIYKYCDTYEEIKYDCDGLYYWHDVIILIRNTQLNSTSDNWIEIPDDMTLQFQFIDVNITDTIIVSKFIQGSSDPCYGNALTVSKSCSKHEKCHFPEIDVKYSHDIYIKNYINGPGLCSNNCIVEYSKGHHCPVPYSLENYNEVNSCWDNHQGELCGQCIEGHSVAINSPYLTCVPCNDTMTVLKGWGLLIVLEFIPVTVMVAVIAVLNFDINQGTLKAYIFFCQILTIPFPSVSYPSWFVILYNYDLRLLMNIPLLVLAIWNLSFISYPSCNASLYNNSIINVCNYKTSICISHNTTAVGAISFWYLIAFYPFILLFLLYSCVLAYDRGFRCVVCVMRPVHRLLARFWRKFNIQPSLPHTIASMYTLCFTQLAATSLKLLHFTTYDNQLRFFYDGSQRYFSGWHGAAGTLALIVLIVFIIVPVVYLSVYPFMWFQKYLNKVKIRKDLLISVTDVFTAPYNNGTKDTLDYRYYASSHFILQLLVMVLYYIPSPDYNIVILALQVCCCTLFLISLVMFRPYKRKIHEFTEAILLLVLITFSLSMIALQLYYIGESAPDNYLFETSNFIIVRAFYPICALFFLISFCFCCGWFIRKYNRRQRVTRKQLWEAHALLADGDPNDQSEDDAILADRIANPDIYNRK